MAEAAGTVQRIVGGAEGAIDADAIVEGFEVAADGAALECAVTREA